MLVVMSRYTSKSVSQLHVYGTLRRFIFVDCPRRYPKVSKLLAAVLLNAGADVNLTLCHTVNGSQNIEKMKSGFPSFCWFHYVPRAEFTTDVLQLDSNRGRR